MDISIKQRSIALVLTVLMVLSIVPFSVFAGAELVPEGMTYISSAVTPLAPGVEETKYTVLDKNGDQVVYYAVSANVATSDTVQVKANYHDNDNTGVWGKATVVEQANAATAKRGYNVVATTNASYYNVSTGQPTGGFFMEGVNINGDSMGNGYPFFAVLKDGTAMIGQKGTFSQYSADIQEAVGGWQMLVWDGKLVATNDTSKYPRSTVGVKANGDVVLMLADGNQKPYSAGLTYVEQGKVMLELGCVAAIELDGGGSATYAAKPEGTDEVVVRSSCCDGTVRSVSNSLMVISTAVADGTFDHANLSVDYAYYAPYSNVSINALGADKGGYPADIPEGATWSLSDDTFGAVADGVFTSTGKTGTVTVNMLVDGAVVGSVDVDVEHPTDIAFQAEKKMVPYGRPSDFTVDAKRNGADMYVEPEAYDFVCTAGSMDGFLFTAPDDGPTEATVTATYKYAELASATIAVEFGRGSDILFDFENGIDEWGTYFDLKEATEKGEYTNGYTISYESDGSSAGNLVENGIHEDVFLATRENGHVYRGDYALGYTLDYRYSQSHANWQYAYLYYWGDPIVLKDVDTGVAGTRLGMWMYIPEEAVGSCARFAYTYKQANGTYNTAYLYLTYQYVEKGFSKLTSDKIPEAGWAYVYVDMSQISDTYVSTSYYKLPDGTLTRAADTNYAPAFIQFIVSSSASGAEKCTFYIDDITLDYSDAVDDRDMPIITNPLILEDQSSYAIDGRTLNYNTITVTADAKEDTSRGTNYTGLNEASAQVYVDGQKVDTKFAGGKISATGIVLPNGTHDITFEIADKQGNYTKLTKQIVIAADTEQPEVVLNGAATVLKTDGMIYTGGQYNITLDTDKVEGIEKVNFKLWLNSASEWALEHLTVLPGFEAEYTLDEKACTADITVTRVDSDAQGAATLLTIPVYAWSWNEELGLQSATYQWNSEGCAPQTAVSYKIKYAEVIYTDAYEVDNAAYVNGFSNKRVDAKTELNSSIANLKKTIKEWHYHTEVAIDDLAATCITKGYEGRTVCSVCASVLDWGTDIPATGHSYVPTDGQLACACGDTIEGTGFHKIEGKVYHTINGVLSTGWVVDSETKEYYYFDLETYAAVTGELTLDENGYTDLHYVFNEDGVLVRGAFKKTARGTRYIMGGEVVVRKWITLEEGTYWVAQDGYLAYGHFPVIESLMSPVIWCHFDEETGIMDCYSNGFFESEGELYYAVEGDTTYGAIEVDGGIIFCATLGKVVRNGSCYISESLEVTAGLEYGTYWCDENGFIVSDGFVTIGENTYYMTDYIKAKGFTKIGDKYYFFNTGNGVMNTDTTLWVSGDNEYGIDSGYYYFQPDGTMYVPDPNGPRAVIEEDGVLYFTIDGVKQKNGLNELDGDYYYARGNGSLARNELVWVSDTKGLIAEKGYYNFDENGKLIKTGFVTGGGYTYYYEDAVRSKGLTKIGEDYYFFNTSSGAMYTNARMWIAGDNSCGLDSGYYYFLEDGKMHIPGPTEVTNDGNVITVTNLEGLKDIIIAKGEYDTYRELADNKVYRVVGTSDKLKNYKWSYKVSENGVYTVLVRFNDGSDAMYTVLDCNEGAVGVLAVEGKTVTVTGLDGLQVIRYVKGEYHTSYDIKRAPGVCNVKADSTKIVDGAFKVTLGSGTYSFVVQFKDGNFVYYIVNI